jgi:hypothetical protein
VWGELRRVGPVQLAQPSGQLAIDERTDHILDTVTAMVPDDVGTVLWLDAFTPEFIDERAKCLAELQREIDQAKFTLAELDERRTERRTTTPPGTANYASGTALARPTPPDQSAASPNARPSSNASRRSSTVPASTDRTALRAKECA